MILVFNLLFSYNFHCRQRHAEDRGGRVLRSSDECMPTSLDPQFPPKFFAKNPFFCLLNSWHLCVVLLYPMKFLAFMDRVLVFEGCGGAVSGVSFVHVGRASRAREVPLHTP